MVDSETSPEILLCHRAVDVFDDDIAADGVEQDDRRAARHLNDQIAAAGDVNTIGQSRFDFLPAYSVPFSAEYASFLWIAALCCRLRPCENHRRAP